MPIEKELIKCPECKKRFPVNYRKHPNRKTVQCPHCRTELKQGIIDKKWKPNEEWHKDKHKSRPFTVSDLRRALGGIVGR